MKNVNTWALFSCSILAMAFYTALLSVNTLSSSFNDFSFDNHMPYTQPSPIPMPLVPLPNAFEEEKREEPVSTPTKKPVKQEIKKIKKNRAQEKQEKLEAKILDIFDIKLKPIADNLTKITQSKEAQEAIKNKQEERKKNEKEAEQRRKASEQRSGRGWQPSGGYGGGRRGGGSRGGDDDFWRSFGGGGSRGGSERGSSGYSSRGRSPESSFDRDRQRDNEYEEAEEEKNTKPTTSSDKDKTSGGTFKSGASDKDDKEFQNDESNYTRARTSVKKAIEALKAIDYDKNGLETVLKNKNFSKFATQLTNYTTASGRLDGISDANKKRLEAKYPDFKSQEAQLKSLCKQIFPKALLAATDTTVKGASKTTEQANIKDLINTETFEEFIGQDAITTAINARGTQLLNDWMAKNPNFAAYKAAHAYYKSLAPGAVAVPPVINGVATTKAQVTTYFTDRQKEINDLNSKMPQEPKAFTDKLAEIDSLTK